jgi:serine/threonine protein kinase
MNELDLFAAALAITDPSERAALLDRECAGQPALRERLKQLLDAHARSNPLLDRPAPGASEQTGAYMPNEQPGTVIAGRYKLLEAIGEGGMGTVWVAEQTQPVRRKVALKLIKAGMDSKSVLARFEAERQALAVMDHPNIAKVLDGGLTESGRPYFVMEYVKGVPITEYCDAVRLSIPERLQLFAMVCQAVQHAHQKGIIHRDLKPSNILVAPYDDKPVPKVIDFGLAKAMHQSLTELTLHTAHESVLGTPLYMSPEQAQLNNLDVDTRSDIYSLGVLLYELLTGTTPLEKKRFKEVAWDEIKRVIREEEPPRPSTRLSSSEALPSLAAGRQIEPAKLTKLLRGELDWIVMKSLEKDRARRYETANGFAMDIHRYLADEPVLAAPASARYRLRKFAAKHRGSLATIGAFAFVLIATTAFSAWQAYRASKAESVARHSEAEAIAERNAANTARDAEGVARRNAENQRLQSEAHFKKAREAVDEYFTKVSESRLLNVPGLQPLRKELLESARKYYQDFVSERGDDKSVRAEAAKAWSRLGNLNTFVGSPQEAALAFQKAQGLYEALLADDPNSLPYRAELARSLQNLGNQQTNLGLLDEALKNQESALALHEQNARADPTNPDYQKSLAINLIAIGETYFGFGRQRDALRCAQRGAAIFQSLAATYPTVDDYRNRVATALLDVGYFQQFAGQPIAALDSSRRALEILKQLVREHPDNLQYASHVALAYGTIGNIQYRFLKQSPAALASVHQAISTWEPLVRDNPTVHLYRENFADCKSQLGIILGKLGQTDESLKTLEVSLALHDAINREQPENIWYEQGLIGNLLTLAKIYRAKGRESEALKLLERARPFIIKQAEENKTNLYEQACMLARASELVRLDKADLTPGELTLRRKYADRAVVTLQKATRAGMVTSDFLETDEDFDSIRNRDDFKALIIELKAKASATSVDKTND